MSTAGQVITCKAAVAYGPKQPLVVEDIQVRNSLSKMAYLTASMRDNDDMK
jgi:hypothetical protein